MVENKCKCSACGAEVDGKEKYCHVCGISLGVPEDVIVVKSDLSGASFVAKLLSAPRAILVRNSVLFFLSLVILLSAFLPIISYNGVKVSPIQSIALASDIVSNVAVEDVNESRFGDKVSLVFKKFFEENLSDIDIGDVGEFIALHTLFSEELENSELSLPIYNFARYIFRVTGGGPVIMAYLSALSVLVYMILAIVLFICAGKNLIRLATGKKTLYRSVMSQFCFMLPFVVVVYFANSSIGLFITKAGIGFWLSVLSLSIGIIYGTVELCINNYKQGKQVLAPRKVIASVLSIILLYMMFVPVFSLTVEGVYEGRSTVKEVTVPIDTAFFSELSPTEIEASAYENIYDSGYYASRISRASLSSIYEMSAREVEHSHEGKTLFVILLTTAYFSNYEVDFAYKFSFVPVIVFVAGLASAFIVWQRMRHLCLDSVRGGVTVSFGIIGTLASAVVLALAIVFVSSLGYALEYAEISSIVSGSVTCGAILPVVAFVANTFMPTKKIVFVNDEKE